MHIFKFAAVVVAIAGFTFAWTFNVSAATLGPFTTSTPIPSSLANWSSSLDFPKFDPGHGVLSSVSLSLFGSFSTVITVQSIQDGVANGNAVGEVLYSVQDGGSNLFEPGLIVIQDPPVINYTLNGGESVSGNASGTNSSASIYTLPTILGEFTGTGNITLSASALARTLIANHGADAIASQVTNASLTGTVKYTYTPVPEPSSCVLLGLGIVVLAGHCRAAQCCRWRRAARCRCED